MRHAFLDPEGVRRQRDKHGIMRQQRYQSVAEYIAEFDQTLLEAQAMSWDDVIKIDYLRRGISNDLKHALITTDEPPEYTEWCRKIETIDLKLEQVKRNNHFPLPTRVVKHFRPAARQHQSGPEPMELDHTLLRTNQQQPKRAKWVDKSNMELRREKGWCLRCGSSTHRIATCPYLPASRPDQPRANQLAIEQSEPLLECDGDDDPSGKV